MGIPVVATDLPEIRRFNARARRHRLGGGRRATRSSAAIRARACTPASGDDVRAAHRGRARRTAGRARIAAMTALIDEALERRAADATSDGTRRCGASIGATRRRAAQIVVGLAARLPAAVPDANSLWWAAAPLKSSAPPRAADAIVVFAGGVGESGKAGGGAQERVKQAVDLYRAGYAPVLVLSSGYVYTLSRSRGDARAGDRQRRAGVGDRARAAAPRTPIENVAFVDEILREHRWQRILLVSSPYHMRRALLVWQQAGAGRHRGADAGAAEPVLRAHARRHARADARHPAGVRGDVRVLAPRLAMTRGGRPRRAGRRR